MKKFFSLSLIFFIFFGSISCGQSCPVIRPYESSYHDQVLELIYQDPFSIFPGKQWIKNGRMTNELFFKQTKNTCEEHLNDSFIFTKYILLDGNTVVGFASYAINKEYTFPENLTQKQKEYVRKVMPHLKENQAACRKYAHIAILVISQKMRRNGLGAQVFNYIERDIKNRFPDVSVIKLDVLDDNSIAQKFFEKLGFVKSDTPLLPHSKEANQISYEKQI